MSKGPGTVTQQGRQTLAWHYTYLPAFQNILTGNSLLSHCSFQPLSPAHPGTCCQDKTWEKGELPESPWLRSRESRPGLAALNLLGRGHSIVMFSDNHRAGVAAGPSPACRCHLAETRGESCPSSSWLPRGLLSEAFLFGVWVVTVEDISWQLAQRTFSVLVILIAVLFHPILQGTRPGPHGGPRLWLLLLCLAPQG